MKKTKLITGSFIVVAMFSIMIACAGGSTEKVERPIPELPYAYEALAPSFDSLTMYVHYNKHYKGYHRKFLAATEGTDLETKTMQEIFSSISKQPAAVRNNSGGYYNHMLFWENLTPEKTAPSADLEAAIVKNFGSVDAFKEKFSATAGSIFGSGWAWLVLTDEGKLVVTSTPNQDNPLMDIAEVKGTPIVALDIWEHAYYIHYQNKRSDYIQAFWNIVNWETMSERFEAAK